MAYAYKQKDALNVKFKTPAGGKSMWAVGCDTTALATAWDLEKDIELREAAEVKAVRPDASRLTLADRITWVRWKFASNLRSTAIFGTIKEHMSPVMGTRPAIEPTTDDAASLFNVRLEAEALALASLNRVRGVLHRV